MCIRDRLMMEFEDLKRYEGAPQLFNSEVTDMSCELHMDDIHGTAPEDVAERFIEHLKSRAPVKKAEIHRVGDTYEFLKRQRTRYAEGMLISVNKKYIDKVVSDIESDSLNSLGHVGKRGLKPAPTPSTKDLEPKPEDDEEPPDFEIAPTSKMVLPGQIVFFCHQMVYPGADHPHRCVRAAMKDEIMRKKMMERRVRLI